MYVINTKGFKTDDANLKFVEIYLIPETINTI